MAAHTPANVKSMFRSLTDRTGRQKRATFIAGKYSTCPDPPHVISILIISLCDIQAQMLPRTGEWQNCLSPEGAGHRQSFSTGSRRLVHYRQKDKNLPEWNLDQHRRLLFWRGPTGALHVKPCTSANFPKLYTKTKQEKWTEQAICNISSSLGLVWECSPRYRIHNFLP